MAAGAAVILSAISLALLLPMLAVGLWNVAAAPRLERAGAPGRHSRVSLLVPARDEAANLAQTLPALLRTDHPALEVLVLDDGSHDGTAALVQHHASTDPRLRLLRGRPLPQGWLGKAWACHQLAEAARGGVLLFCDADVTAGPDAVTRTIGAMEAAGAGAATVLPRQRFGGWMDRAVVPLVAQLPVLALLPMSLVPRVRAPSLSMANGQWLAFTRQAYADCGGHAAVRADVVEDVALGRRVKAAGHRLLPLVSTASIHVRMYGDADALREGFAKNVYALTGGRPAPFALALAVFAMAAVYPWAGALLGVPGALGALAALAAVRTCGALLFRHGFGTVLLHPVGSVALVGIALRSYAGARRGTLRWRGRRIVANEGTGRAAG